MAKRYSHNPRICRGDTVAVITGDDKGSRGRVLRVLADTDRIVVEGVNLVYRHVRRSQKNPQGGRVRREAAVHISNVMLVDPASDEPTKVGRRHQDPEKGSRGWVRVARRTGQAVGDTPGKAPKAGKTPKKGKKEKKEKKEKKGKE